MRNLLEQLRTSSQHTQVPVFRGAGEHILLAFQLLKHQLFQHDLPQLSVRWATLNERQVSRFGNNLHLGPFDRLDVKIGWCSTDKTVQ